MFRRSIQLIIRLDAWKSSWIKKNLLCILILWDFFLISELIAIEKEIQEVQNTPSLSEEEIQEYCVEKASLERKQSGDLL